MNTDNSATYGNAFALMQEGANQFYIYRFYCDETMSKRMMWTINPSIATNLSQAKLRAFASQRTFLLYAIGSTLYAYDYNPGNEKLYQLNMGDEITCIEFNTNYDPTGNTLWVGTYNASTQGTLTSYALSLDPNKFELTQKSRWTNLVKVVDIDWRNSDQ